VQPGERPLIAVTTSEIRQRRSTLTSQGAPEREEMALGLNYLQAIEAAGGIPVVTPPLGRGAIEPLLGRVSGVCLSGGPDLDPVAYGAFRHELTGPSWAELDRFELRLARAADAVDLPILAICRGMQVLNVSRGGTLHQHLPDVAGGRVRHRQSSASGDPTHWVTLDAESRLGDLAGSARQMVNSFHHQAVAALGRGLTATATADDGTIEAIEAIDREFVLGVQWHAECLVDQNEHAGLFEAFVDAARQYENGALELRRAA
jgi:putative glutamine amidotransferase